jgi:hypothetical protein
MIFDFWRNCPRDATIHPADAEVLKRVKHSFDLRCPIGHFDGPLRTAPVVMLYLNPGLSPEDYENADFERNARQWTGDAIPSADHKAANRWRASRFGLFGHDLDMLGQKLATLNVGCYHSKSFKDHALLAALPSSRVSIQWAQEVLFPDAIAGRRVAIVMRAHSFWGVARGKVYGEALFAPETTRGGHMIRGAMRDKIVSAVRQALSRSE